jgi:hypothetical protein
VSESDRELRDRLESAQSELQHARARLDELEEVASERDAVREQLEAIQARLKQANERLAVLDQVGVEVLQEELALLRQRLEQADKTREQWDQKVAQREAELAVAHAEQWRLKEELARRPAPPRPRTPRWMVAVPLLSALASALLLLRSCG